MIIWNVICLVWSVWVAIYEDRLFWRITGIICIPVNAVLIIKALSQ